MTSLTTTRPRRYILTRHHLVVAVLFIAIFTMAVRVPNDPDTYWHLRSGQYIVETHSLFTGDIFSHTRAGQPWIYPKLAQIFWYGLFALGGWAGLSLGVAILVTVAFAFIWPVTPGNLYLRAFSLLAGAITSAVIWAARPQLVSFVLAGLLLLCLERYKRTGSRWIYAMPFITMVWANVHGGYAVAFILLAAYIAGEVLNHLTRHSADPVLSWSQLKLLVGLGLVSFATVALNPYGWQMWLYPFQTIGIGALRDFIMEWQSPDFHEVITWPFVGMFMITLVALARAGRPVDWTDLVLIALWTGWSLFARRNIGLYGLLTVPALARYADAAWGHLLPAGGPSRLDRQPVIQALNWLVLGLIVVVALVKISLPLSPAASQKVEQAGMPYEAVEFMRQHQLPDSLFNSYDWGGYLIFKLWPDYPVYIDGRTDLYDEAMMRRYLAVVTGADNWQQILDEDGVNTVLIGRDSTLEKFLRLEPQWQEVYRDDRAVIFTRK